MKQFCPFGWDLQVVLLFVFFFFFSRMDVNLRTRSNGVFQFQMIPPMVRDFNLKNFSFRVENHFGCQRVSARAAPRSGPRGLSHPSWRC